jgi:hypothetical protein
MSELIRAVAKAICKSRTCEGVSCCQWPAQGGRTQCPVKDGGYDDAARDAISAVKAYLVESGRDTGSAIHTLNAANTSGDRNTNDPVSTPLNPTTHPTTKGS